VGSAAPYLQENMTVKLSLHGLVPVAITMPQRATWKSWRPSRSPRARPRRRPTSRHPVQRRANQRAAACRTGTRIVVMTEDGSYVERAKD